jgi:isoleucyl-tRNA synthetase
LAFAVENLAKSIAPVLCHLAEDIWQFLPYSTPHKSVFQAGWVDIPTSWKQPDLVKTWTKIRDLRDDVNKVMETARKEKSIGASLEAKVLLYIEDKEWLGHLNKFNLSDSLRGNRVDELRYFFLASQVELLDSTDAINKAQYKSETGNIAVVKADGEKCDRCWNYSTHVGEFKDDPTICDRCNKALVGEF